MRYIDADKVKEKILNIGVLVMCGRSGGKTIFTEALNSYREKVLQAIDDTPTADVVPRSEVEELKRENESLAKTVNEASELIRKLRSKVETSKTEVAREIFEKIESAKVSIGDFKIKTFKIISLGEVAEQTITGDMVAFSDIAELKKKYTEGEE